MSFLSTINIIGSGITAQHLRLDVISENVTNINTTRTEEGGPYRRKMVVFQAQNATRDAFRVAMDRARNGMVSNAGFETSGGVRVVEIAEDPSDFKLKYDPTDPDANEEGYVELPNVDLVKEITDAMAASQAYSADVTAFNVLKSVISSGLEIGR
ncbi:MAG: flagellar basal body rod protein FlgC [Oscillospiraceae bacterium]|jgi:flagellar basal-body rod protein FlgC|nr:flagellar basal body rod protein FlgC [Oscillospiraceae bacterium]MCI8721372.1 flagellar basal body rod protein FlgC [Oscillospiraceae bacterium]MCI8943089.1 flagellar basal body rod protein FlgC [Oscillospiraceae bacterium]